MSKAKIEEAKKRVLAALTEVRLRESASATEGKAALEQFLSKGGKPQAKPGEITFPNAGNALRPMPDNTSPMPGSVPETGFMRPPPGGGPNVA